MENGLEVRDFLASRRARLTPEDVGLPGGGRRRVAGLRRGEVAQVAGVSVEYYSRLERGHLAGASDSVLLAVADALRLDDAERAHLLDLARAASGSPARRRPRPKQLAIRPGVQRTLDAITGGPAFIRNGRMDMLAVNPLARALYDVMFQGTDARPNHARFIFLDDRARDFYRNWDHSADAMVTILRTEAGRDPFDSDLSNLIGELSTRSPEFRVRWAAHNVREHYFGMKRFHHPVVGDLTLTYEDMQLPSDPSLSVLVYTAEPGSPDADALELLASWAATQALSSAELTQQRGD